MQKIAYVECERFNGISYIAATYSYVSIYDATGQPMPINANTTVYGVCVTPDVAALIEADANCLVHTDDNLFLDFDNDANPDVHWRNELEAWLNG